MQKRRALLVFAAMLGLLAPGIVWAQSSVSEIAAEKPSDQALKVQASLLAESPSVAPGQTVTVALREIITPKWHTYWRNPGDSGEPSAITWHLPEGWQASEIKWPYPERIPVGPLMNFGYENEVLLLTEITAPKDALPGDAMLTADVTWLVCSDVCIPEEEHLSLPLAVSAEPGAPTSANAVLIQSARAKLPRANAFKSTFKADDAKIALSIEGEDLASAKNAAFFPYTDGYVDNDVAQKTGVSAKGVVLRGKTGWRLATEDKRKVSGAGVNGILVLTAANGSANAYEIAAVPGEIPPAEFPADAAAAQPSIGLLRALFFAFLGGLILNLMPCVFPVLSMKALALARKANAERAARADSLAYGVGVMACFALLAGALLLLRAGGEAVGWGFQLQNPIVVSIFALLIFAVGLNLAGVFEVSGGRFAGIGHKFTVKGGVVGSFFTGALAVAVATPCTAPFMGAALGFALTQGTWLAFGVFMALGFGFALPFVALGYMPSLLGMLPRPGTWTVRFKQILAFPMFGAAIWLVWVLGQEVGPDGVLAILAASLALGFALWSYGVSQDAGPIGRITGLGAAIIAFTVMALLVPRNMQVQSPASVALSYENYSVDKLAELRAQNRPVFIDATAAWCITCLVNERVALSEQKVVETFASRNIVALKADWTNRDPEITKLLTTYGRLGVPLYLYFAPGASEPVILPQILTGAGVIEALTSTQHAGN